MEIVTWNLQGGTGKWKGTGQNKAKWDRIREVLCNATFDMLLLQEMTEPPGAASCLREHTDYSLWAWQVETVTWYIVYFRWKATDPGNARCSLAILLKHYEPDESEVFITAGNKRPLIGVQPGQGLPLIWTLHAVSGGGGQNDALDLLAGLQECGSPWLIAGDFNTRPEDLEWKKYRELSRGIYYQWTVCPPVTATHQSGHLLDYAIRSEDCPGDSACQYFHSDHLVGLSDHFPQTLSITAPSLFARRLAD
jgi:endonuclease/exonuclease/phosphatase family metal-dependent hydrolase